MPQFVRTTLLSLLICTTSLFASPLIGDVSISFGAVQITATTVDFAPSGTGTGGFTVNSATGDLASAGLSGTIQDMNRTSEPVATLINITNFLTFSGNPNLSYTLNIVNAGTYSSTDCASAPAGGQTCTPVVPGGSPFNLFNISATSSIASFNVLGTMQDTSLVGSDPTVYYGRFFAIIGSDYQSVLTTFQGGGSVTTLGALATFSTTPEPSTVGLMFAPLLVGALLARKRLFR